MSDVLELVIERPVAGGRMLARHDGRIVFVSGAIPGERVRAKVHRASKHSLWADTIDVIEASPDRRPAICDAACGGLAFAHVKYQRQLDLKREIIADAFRRVGRLTLDALPPVASSPEAGYRLRARLHVREGRAGFFREGTHLLCDAAATQQLLPAALDAIGKMVTTLGSRARDCDAITVAENVAATERVLHLDPRDGARLDDVGESVRSMTGAGSEVTGVTTMVRGRLLALAGSPMVADTSDTLLGAPPLLGPGVRWSRRPTSFFQGNRYLTGPLVRHVLNAAPGERCVDFYAGVGLFSVALAARGSRVLAVEGDGSSGDDLVANAQPWAATIKVIRGAVEDAVRRPLSPPPDVVIVDPPRTGLSAEALEHLADWEAPRLVYVSCDPPTLARDAARLAPHGFGLVALDAFDLFPNTPHVETVAVFVRSAR